MRLHSAYKSVLSSPFTRNTVVFISLAPCRAKQYSSYLFFKGLTVVDKQLVYLHMQTLFLSHFQSSFKPDMEVVWFRNYFGTFKAGLVKTSLETGLNQFGNWFEPV